jgi:hypothetical protein
MYGIYLDISSISGVRIKQSCHCLFYLNVHMETASIILCSVLVRANVVTSVSRYTSDMPSRHGISHAYFTVRRHDRRNTVSKSESNSAGDQIQKETGYKEHI